MGELDDEAKERLKPKNELSKKEKFFYSMLFIVLNALMIWLFIYSGILN